MTGDKPTIGRRAALQAAAALLGGGAVAGTAAGQEGTSTSTPTPSSIVVELGGNVRVTDWEQESGTFRVTVDADIPSALKITDTGAVMASMTTGDGADVVEIPTQGYSVGSGETVIEFAAEAFQGAHALTIASSDGAALIRTDSVDAGGNPPVQFGTAVTGVGAAAIGTGWYSLRRGAEAVDDEDEETEVERLS